MKTTQDDKGESKTAATPTIRMGREVKSKATSCSDKTKDTECADKKEKTSEEKASALV